MNIQSVNDKAFEVYGRVVDGYDYAELLATLEKLSLIHISEPTRPY